MKSLTSVFSQKAWRTVIFAAAVFAGVAGGVPQAHAASNQAQAIPTQKNQKSGCRDVEPGELFLDIVLTSGAVTGAGIALGAGLDSLTRRYMG
jgi:hypothetical protein